MPVDDVDIVPVFEGGCELEKLMELVGIVVDVKAGVGAGEALRRVAMLRPRKVMAERVASESPASHSVDKRMPLEKALLGMSWVMFA